MSVDPAFVAVVVCVYERYWERRLGYLSGWETRGTVPGRDISSCRKIGHGLHDHSMNEKRMHSVPVCLCLKLDGEIDPG